MRRLYIFLAIYLLLAIGVADSSSKKSQIATIPDPNQGKKTQESLIAKGADANAKDSPSNKLPASTQAVAASPGESNSAANEPNRQQYKKAYGAAGSTQPGDVNVAPTHLAEVEVVGILNKARENIAPSLGATEYSMNHDAIASQSQGDNAAFNQMILRAPGVAEDSFGQLHIRGEHANLQYRINDVLIPEGISGFGQELDTRFVDNVSLITGALPAQYGFHTAGIVDIQAKSGLENGGTASLYGGSNSTINPSFSYGGSDAEKGVNYFVTGSYLTDDLGIENPTSSKTAIHDQTQQEKTFVYFSKLIDDTSRVSFMFSSYNGDFQIPNNPGLTPVFTLAGVPTYKSSDLKEQQTEQNYFGILTYQKTLGDLNFQVSAFSQYSQTLFKPDIKGDLIFNGVASQVQDSIINNGIEFDGSYVLNDSHTLRSGFSATFSDVTNDNSSWVFPGTGAGPSLIQTGDNPFEIVDNHQKQGSLYGVYLQDEWKVTEPLTINYGGRFDQYYQYLNEDQFSPRVNAVYEVDKDTVVHAGYARYFTPPPFELAQNLNPHIYDNTTNALEVTENSAAKAERANYFDAGITHNFSEEFKMGLDGYYKTAKDQLDDGQFGAAIIETPFNYEYGKVYGAELTANYKKEGFSAYGNVALSRAIGKDISSEQFNFSQAELDYISDHWIHLDHDQTITISAGASYSFSNTRVYADWLYGSGLRKDAGDVPNGAAVGTYYPVNAGIEHTFKLKNKRDLKIRFDIVNVFDEVYELRTGTGVGVGAPQFGQRRGFYGGLSFNF